MSLLVEPVPDGLQDRSEGGDSDSAEGTTKRKLVRVSSLLERKRENSRSNKQDRLELGEILRSRSERSASKQKKKKISQHSLIVLDPNQLEATRSLVRTHPSTITLGNVLFKGGVTTFATSFLSPIAFFSPSGFFSPRGALSGMLHPRAFANAVVQSPATRM